jgi:predicted branched-subunit amino acid permease
VTEEEVDDRPDGPAQVRAATRQGISVGLATGVYGVSFGALAVAAGLDVWQACALSLLMFTGGSQFAFVGVVGAGGAGAAATTAAALLGARNALYSLQVAPMLGLAGPSLRHRTGRLLAAHLTIDESTAVGTLQEDPTARRRGFWVTGLAVFVLWNATTLAGALLGDVLGDPRRFGLDGAAAAAFLGLMWPRLRTGDARAVGVVGAVLAVLAVPVAPPGVPVLVAGLGAAVAGAVQLRRARAAGTRVAR